MRVKVTLLCSLVFSYGCASGQYTTESGQERNAWVDLLVVAAAMPSSTDSPRERARKSGMVSGYLSEANAEEYDGNCMCPYDLAADGTRCGSRSAWSKPEGETPFCDYRKITNLDFDEKWK